MTTIFDETSNSFSREAVRKAVTQSGIDADPNSVELNELAQQVAEQFTAGSISPLVVASIVRILELLGISAIGIWFFAADIFPVTGIMNWHSLMSFLGAILTVAFIQGLDGYQFPSTQNIVGQTAKVATAFTMALLIVAAGSFLVAGDGDVTLAWLTKWYGVGLLFLVFFRSTVSFYVKNLSLQGRIERRAVIIGGGDPAADLIRSLEAQAQSDIRICGIFDDRGGDRSPPVVAGYPKLGNVPELVAFARKARINMLIVSLPLSAEKRLLQLLKQLWVLPVDIRLSAHTNKLSFRPRTFTYEGALPFFDVFERPIADWDAIMKRGFDLLFASMALVVLSPLMIATAIAIKLESRGPIFFRQKRHGFNNVMIDVWKFRSLRHEMRDESCAKAVTRDDKRVTRVGRVIRKTSIDELPQLFNVLCGSLSLVGPRPHVVNAQTNNRLWDSVVDGYFARHKVKPGVTGWAQINGWRGEIDEDEKLQERVNHDLYYIENWSLLLDLYILFVTPFKLLNTENAY